MQNDTTENIDDRIPPLYGLVLVTILSIAIAAVMILLGATVVHAQGTDFPVGVWAPVPSWAPVTTLTPVPGWDYSTGTAAGPYYLSNRRGDKIHIDFRWDWWSLGPVQLVIRTNGDNDQLAWDDGSFWWHGLCLQHCAAEFEASNDNTVVWLEYAGTQQFGAHLDFTVIAKPSFSILPDWSKQTCHNIGNALVGFGAGAAIVASLPCNAGDVLSCSIVNTTGILAGLAGGLLLQVDPWDDAYAYAVDPSFPNAGDIGLSYLGGGYGNDFWDTIVNDNNVMVNATINISGNLNAANTSVNRANSCAQIGDSCADWEAERALEFFEAANQNAYDAAAAMWELSYQYQQQGFGQDYQDLWNQAAGQF